MVERRKKKRQDSLFTVEEKKRRPRVRGTAQCEWLALPPGVMLTFEGYTEMPLTLTGCGTESAPTPCLGSMVKLALGMGHG